MRLKNSARYFPAIALLLSLFAVPLQAQAPPSIQFFMPDGSLPPREVRFTMTSDDGLVQTYFSDSKGRFLITRKEGLKPDSAYTVTVIGDGRTFGNTTTSFKHYGVYYVTIFLNPVEETKTRPAGVVDVSELDEKASTEARAAYDSANQALSEGRLNDAVERFHHAITLYPNYFRALNDLGVLLIRLRRYDEAVTIFEHAIEIAPQVYYPRLNLAVIKTRQGNYQDAINMLEKLHKEYPTFTQIRIALADALIADNRLKDAEGHLRTALEDKKLIADKRGNVLYLLGLVHNKQGRYAEAAKTLEQAVKVLPTAPRAHLQFGAALLLLNKLDDAERELKAAYELGGVSLGGAQFLLGQLYFTQKKYELAKQAFERYLTDVPDAPNKIEVAKVIDQIKAAKPPDK
ncbi:MAG: tetratricopeptide repeat protein [Acidobacteriota bacterium]